jgi:hypothetical protein
MTAATAKPTTEELITMTQAFITKAKRDGRTSDAAYGKGALDALHDIPADFERHGLLAEDSQRAYLSGWCRVNGF